MSITLGKNIASLRAQRQLFSTGKQLSTVFERLSSGQRINKSSDDAAGLAIADTLRTDSRVYNQAVRNLNDGLSILNIADSTVSELSSVVIRIQELAEQAANGTLSNTQRGSLDQEAQALSDEFFRISRAVDFNGLRLFDGSIEDGIRLQAGYGTDGSIFSSLGGEMGDGTFQAAQTVSTGNSPRTIRLADLNGDGETDFVTSNGYGDDISVLLGNGDGTFQTEKNFGAGDVSHGLTLADFNGDGIIDVATANQGSDDSTILLGNGDGSFQSRQTFSAGDSPLGISHGDLNGDGVLDLVTANVDSDDISVLMGIGDGTFRSQQTFAAGARPNVLALGDFSGDGILDIVTPNFSGNDVTLLIGNGDGTFQSPTTFGVGAAPISIALGDLNGDGELDLVTSNYDSDDVTSLLGNGDGTFQARETFGAGDIPFAISLGDVNGDGTLDIVTGNRASGDATVLIGNGDGSFQGRSTFAAGNSPDSVALGDLNGDGVLELLTANRNGDNVSIFFGNTREGIAPILDFSLETQADALQALAPLERKLNSLSEQRGIIGAFQSRIETAISTLTSTGENYAGAESRIRDADIAFESSQLTRLNILQQAASAVLGQANQQPALALQLLR